MNGGDKLQRKQNTASLNITMKTFDKSKLMKIFHFQAVVVAVVCRPTLRKWLDLLGTICSQPLSVRVHAPL